MSEDYLWAEPYPEIHKICKLFNITELKHPVRYCYNGLKPYIQEGPQCGLVALAIAARNSTKEHVDELMKHALDLGYTYNGEMLNAFHMYDLTKLCLPNKRINMYEGYLNNDFIIKFLFDNGFLLVPYDSDQNHSPCMKQGHKAHWAIICGIVETQCENFVFARHGKSNNVAIWSLSDLANSNAQLEQFSPDRKLSDVEYKLPEGGIGGHFGLKCKTVLIYN